MGASAVDFPEVDDDFCGSGDGDAGSEIGLRESTAEYRDSSSSSSAASSTGVCDGKESSVEVEVSAWEAEFDDSAWEAVDTPHDWMIHDLPSREQDTSRRRGNFMLSP